LYIFNFNLKKKKRYELLFQSNIRKQPLSGDYSKDETDRD